MLVLIPCISTLFGKFVTQGRFVGQWVVLDCSTTHRKGMVGVEYHAYISQLPLYSLGIYVFRTRVKKLISDFYDSP